MYNSELNALFEGAQLRTLDQRRYMTEQAVSIANATMSKNPKSAIKKTYREFDKQERKIDVHKQLNINHPKMEQYAQLMKQWHNSFKRKEEDNGS